MILLYHLQAAGEADQVGTQTEARALARRHTDRRRDQVQHSEDRGGDQRQRRDLVNRQTLPGNEDSRTRNDQTLNQILNGAVEYFRDVHLLLY